MANAASSTSGYIACVCFALLLMPQIYENYTRRSTDGLSLVMIAVWLFAGVFFAAYLFATDANIALLFQWHIVNTFCCVIAGQWYRYRPSAVAKAAVVAETNRRAHVHAVHVRNADIQDGVGGVEDIRRSSSALAVNGNHYNNTANGSSIIAHSNGVAPMDIDSVPSTSASFTASPSPLADVIVEPSVATDNAAAHINGISNGVVMKKDDLAVAVAATNGSNISNGVNAATGGVVGQSFGSIGPAVAFVVVWLIIYWVICIIFWKIFDAAKDTVIPVIFGSIAPTVLLILGFVPQVALIRRLKSSQGFSRGLSIMDLSGCTISIVSIAVDDTVDYVAMIPYASVVICQVGMLILTTCIYPVSKPPVRYIAYDDDEQPKSTSIATTHATSLEPRKLARDEVADVIGTNGRSSHDNGVDGTTTVISDINGVDGSDHVRQLARHQIKQTLAANGNSTQRNNNSKSVAVPGLR